MLEGDQRSLKELNAVKDVSKGSLVTLWILVVLTIIGKHLNFVRLDIAALLSLFVALFECVIRG